MEIDWVKSKNSGARQGRSRKDWGNPVEDAKKVNAKANTKGEVAINGRGVKIARRSAAVLA